MVMTPHDMNLRFQFKKGNTVFFNINILNKCLKQNVRMDMLIFFCTTRVIGYEMHKHQPYLVTDSCPFVSPFKKNKIKLNSDQIFLIQGTSRNLRENSIQIYGYNIVNKCLCPKRNRLVNFQKYFTFLHRVAHLFICFF